MNTVKDKELALYQSEIGKVEYKRIQAYMCNRSKRIRDNDLRASGKHYENDNDKIDEIRKKYKDGITVVILEEFVNKIM